MEQKEARYTVEFYKIKTRKEGEPTLSSHLSNASTFDTLKTFEYGNTRGKYKIYKIDKVDIPDGKGAFDEVYLGSFVLFSNELPIYGVSDTNKVSGIGHKEDTAHLYEEHNIKPTKMSTFLFYPRQEVLLFERGSQYGINHYSFRLFIKNAIKQDLEFGIMLRDQDQMERIRKLGRITRFEFRVSLGADMLTGTSAEGIQKIQNNDYNARNHTTIVSSTTRAGIDKNKVLNTIRDHLSLGIIKACKVNGDDEFDDRDCIDLIQDRFIEPYNIKYDGVYQFNYSASLERLKQCWQKHKTFIVANNYT
jgi:hypothetical protein